MCHRHMLAHMKKISAGHSERVSCTARDGHVHLTDCLGIETAPPGFYICNHTFLAFRSFRYIYIYTRVYASLLVYLAMDVFVYIIYVYRYIQ